MRVRIDVEIPNWTRWVVASAAMVLALGYGLVALCAAPLAVKVWQTDDLLTAADLNQSFGEIKGAVDRQQIALDTLAATDCPIGYTRDALAASMVLCKKGPDEVVRVSQGRAAFWVDRFESTIWSQPDSLVVQYGVSSDKEFPSGFPISGQYSTPLYALSAAGYLPTAYVSWFQADAACELVGKRLPTREEWIRAARGTVDPGSSDGAAGDCLTVGPARRRTGLGTKCRSIWGAEDMIGNLWEWTAEWYAGLGDGTVDYSLPRALFNDDVVINVTSMATNSVGEMVRMPAGANRGGGFTDGAKAGLFALNLLFAPTFPTLNVGFRCAM
jgi:hypothetical protein